MAKRKQSTPNFPKNEYFLPSVTHTYMCVSGGKKCSLIGKLGVLFFLLTSVLRFVLLPYYWWIFNMECTAIIKKRKKLQKWGNNLTYLIYLIRDLKKQISKFWSKCYFTFKTYPIFLIGVPYKKNLISERRQKEYKILIGKSICFVS